MSIHVPLLPCVSIHAPPLPCVCPNMHPHYHVRVHTCTPTTVCVHTRTPTTMCVSIHAPPLLCVSIHAPPLPCVCPYMYPYCGVNKCMCIALISSRLTRKWGNRPGKDLIAPEKKWAIKYRLHLRTLSATPFFLQNAESH